MKINIHKTTKKHLILQKNIYNILMGINKNMTVYIYVIVFDVKEYKGNEER
ncbi:hypothetical protein BJV85_000055 [Clostridium acetobutylicum]|nr:hypothetical protein [Clostridium acetobutylicum]NOW14570.1 hypothetical protein [Clostridium acetobutylicum]NRY58585.1 hypothetical protein [Clostridium acetobutylicum]NSA91209.1 hypothetical protein [Clostridium acetobutylicum]NYC92142.1 hypothetical protein [Clostridium acetobutylicum]